MSNHTDNFGISTNKLILSTLSTTSGSSEFQAPEIDKNEVKFEEKIGSGCFGNVYRGVCRGKQVAIKKLLTQDLDDNTLDEFRKEVEIMTHLRHPNIVLFMGACTELGHLMIVTELMPKGSLHDLLANSKIEITLLQKVKMMKDIALGMNWLHCSKPPIIHRDLKPTNVLVDDNWNLKICDFGLSTIKRSDTLVDDGAAPGTPLWMSPEVLTGQEINEKSDVYSFAIVCWEIFERKEPFDNHDSYTTFVNAICNKKERPPLSNKLHPKLRYLIEECWQEKSDARPSFGQIIPILEDITVSCALNDIDAQNLWKKVADKKTTIPFRNFSHRLWYLLDKGAPSIDSLDYLCMESLLAEQDKKEETDIITLERFSLFIHWFGSLKSIIDGKNIIERVKFLCEKEFFHGDISRQEADQKLAKEKKGHFLVRLSTTEPEKTPFTISKVNRHGVINHQRVNALPNDAGYYVSIKSDKEIKRIECKGSIYDLIKKSSKDLYLKKECSGSKFSSIFQKEEKFGGYLQEY